MFMRFNVSIEVLAGCLYITGVSSLPVPAPVTVPGLSQVQVINGFTVFARWSRVTGNTGQLTQYLLRAYNMDDTNATVVEAVFNITGPTSGRHGG